MQRLALVGYGRMGRRVGELAPGYGFEVAAALAAADNPGGAGLTAERLQGIDVAIDFSVAAAVPGNVERLAALGVPVVVGTTGWAAELPRVRAAVERAGSGLVYGANFSVGVQIFYRLAETAGRLMTAAEDYGAWAYEIHHDKKKDAPSGTLLELVRRLTGAGFPRAVDVASSRAGAIPGTHVVGFDSEADTITLEHRARSRDGFARGALQAARWLVGRTGFHEFGDIWEETL
ncbi:MAG TPA: dihydrodipicolinate reductase C-terminal domain-containing protein [Thermoanaerobaculia bacterium]|nr:dihydrodipicolinate reductase C-terminal domain-containing protein [Thermoanaerobaculia bacterium]